MDYIHDIKPVVNYRFELIEGPLIKGQFSQLSVLETTVQITFIFIDFRVCDFAFAFKTQNAPCVSRFKRVLFSDRFQFAF